jgi:hypothetical protein
VKDLSLLEAKGSFKRSTQHPLHLACPRETTVQKPSHVILTPLLIRYEYLVDIGEGQARGWTTAENV